MCKASVDARKTRDPKIGDQTVLGTSPHGFPQVTRSQDAADDCVTCAKIGQNMRFENVPAHFQQLLQVPAQFDATFVEDIDDTPDTIFYDGRQIELMELAHYSQQQSSSNKVRVTMLSMMNASQREVMIDTIYGRQTQTPARRAADRVLTTTAA